MEEYALYIASKLFGYSAWCALGLVLVKRAAFPRALGFGFIRLLLGLGFGFAVFILYHPDSSANLLAPYLAVYGPIRWLEWSITAKLIKPTERLLWSQDMRFNLWRLGGIAVSFAIDFLSPEGMKGMFCVGRCLC